MDIVSGQRQAGIGSKIFLIFMSVVGLILIFALICKAVGFRPNILHYIGFRSPGQVAIESVLDDWKKGKTTSEFNFSGKSLYNVKSYTKIEDRELIGDGIERHWYRIQSTVKAGFPIDVIWQISTLKFDGEWRITSIEQAQ